MKRYHIALDDHVLFKIKDQEEYPVKEPHVVLEVNPYQKQKEIVLEFMKNNLAV